MKQQERKYNLLAYGNERIGITQPSQDISNRNFVLSFEPFNTDKRFHEFDGVILFQGIFNTNMERAMEENIYTILMIVTN